MPSANRWAFVRNGIRSHPMLVATSAATVGVMLGGFVAVEIFAPVKPNVTGAPAQQVAVKAKPAVKPVAETTGSAPAGETTAVTNCDRETWPYLSRTCADQLRSKHQGPRVITTDKLDRPTISAMEAQPLAPPPTAPKPAAPAIASTAPAATPAPTPTPAAPSIAAATAAPPPAPAIASIAPASSQPAPVAPPPATPAPETPAVASVLAPTKAEAAEAPPAEPVVKAEAKKDKRIAKRSRHKAKPAKDDADDGDNSTVASNDSGERATADDERTEDRRASGDRRDSRRHRGVDRRHIVTRWIERVPADDGDGERRVIVRRGGGLFESLFGFGRSRGDDDD